MSNHKWELPLTLNDFRPILEETASQSGVVLDFLMRQWNGRFATYNIGQPTETVQDNRRNVRKETRYYKLLGRLKANSKGGTLHLTLSPPTACDITPTPEEQALWEGFVAKLLEGVS